MQAWLGQRLAGKKGNQNSRYWPALAFKSIATSMFKSFWNLLSQHVLSPQVNSADVEERLRRARSALPKPVIWLLGKTQSGKTSIIRAMTGSTQPEIGNGFRPCTRTAQLYAFPNDAECLVRFLDTRGLGEASYDPAEDLAFCQDQSHLLMVVVRAMDHALAAAQDAVRVIHKAKPEWSVIVVQTALHDGYARGIAHPLPYPFDAEPWPNSVAPDLARSLMCQREQFAGLASRFVVVDFTLPEDGFLPERYGLEALWNAVEAELPLGLRAMFQQQPELQAELADLYYRTAWPHIVSYSVAAGAVGAVPLPFLSAPSVVAIDAQMFRAIASIYQQPLTTQVMSELGGAIGTGFLVRLAGRSLLAMIPGVGTAAAALYTAATTYALGCTLCWYFSQIKKGITPSAEKLRKFYAQEMEEGRRRFEEYLKSRNNPPSP
jgi:uncharacterized protein (DUF697 family)